mmetsp:Transcript_24659/g.40102  ORF Transcript_24659/g.40102 Transcript_24659/m.40102 type:complete len:201 (+) Transcript_24659:143-745(+)
MIHKAKTRLARKTWHVQRHLNGAQGLVVTVLAIGTTTGHTNTHLISLLISSRVGEQAKSHLALRTLGRVFLANETIFGTCFAGSLVLVSVPFLALLALPQVAADFAIGWTLSAVQHIGHGRSGTQGACLLVLSDGVDCNFFIPRKWTDLDVRKVWKGLFVHRDSTLILQKFLENILNLLGLVALPLHPGHQLQRRHGHAA